jgi:excisionase family DNA binding protein
MVKGYLTTHEAAQELNLSIRRVVELINESHLPAEKVGRSYLVKEKDLDLVRDRRRPGRPRKLNDDKLKESAA